MVIHALFSELFEPLRTFLTSDSGYVQPREGLGLGWVAGALAVLAALFYIPSAKAEDIPFPLHFCTGLQPNECHYVCSFVECEPGKIWEDKFCLEGGVCYWKGGDASKCGSC
jgi:hypothetical protein